MIFVWLKKLLIFLLKLVLPPPLPPLPKSKIDVNAYCPVCGHCDGQIEAKWETPIILEAQPNGGEQKIKLGKIYAEHLCHICKARWYTAMIDQEAQGKVVANG